MAVSTITSPPEAPSLNDQDNFDSEADAFIAWLTTFVSDFNGNAAELNAAVAAAANAIAAANATVWTSGEAITEGDGRYSPTDYQSYRATTDIAGVANTTDPAADSSGNWVKLSSGEVTIPTFTGSGTGSAGDLVAYDRGTNKVKAITGTASQTESQGAVFTLTSTGLQGTIADHCIMGSTGYIGAGYYDDGADIFYLDIFSVSGVTLTREAQITVLSGAAPNSAGVKLCWSESAQKVCYLYRDDSTVAVRSVSATDWTDNATATVSSAASMSDWSATDFSSENYQDLYDVGNSRAMFVGRRDSTDGCAATTIDLSSAAPDPGGYVQASNFTSSDFASCQDTRRNRILTFHNAISPAEPAAGQSGTTLTCTAFRPVGKNGVVIENINFDITYVSTISLSDPTAAYSQNLDLAYLQNNEEIYILGVSDSGVWVSDNTKSTPSPVTDLAEAGFDWSTNKIVNIWQNNSDTDDGYYNVGEYDTDTSGHITWGSDVEFETNSMSFGVEPQAVDYHPNSGSVACLYCVRNGATNSPVKMFMLRTAGNASENAWNYIGIAQNAWSDGGQVSVMPHGMVDTNQTGLDTKAEKYFVDYDGSLSATPTGFGVAGYPLGTDKLQIAANPLLQVGGL